MGFHLAIRGGRKSLGQTTVLLAPLGSLQDLIVSFSFGVYNSKILMKGHNCSFTLQFQIQAALKIPGPAAVDGKGQGPPHPTPGPGLPWETAGPTQVQKDLRGRGSPQSLPRACQSRVLSGKTQQPSSTQQQVSGPCSQKTQSPAEATPTRARPGPAPPRLRPRTAFSGAALNQQPAQTRLFPSCSFQSRDPTKT